MSSFEQRPFARSSANAGFTGRAAAQAPGFVEAPLARRSARSARAAGEPDDTAPLVDAPRILGEDDLETRLAEARAQGRAEGAALAETRFAVEAKRALGALQAGLDDARAHEERALAALAHRALSLASEIAERVLRRSVAHDLSALAPCVEEALAALAPETPATLALAPADLEQLRVGGAAALAQLAERSLLVLREDASLERGEAALVAGPARVELRWNAITERLRAALEEQLPLPEAQA